MIRIVAVQLTATKNWEVNTYNANGLDLNELTGSGIVYFVNGTNTPASKTTGCCLYFSYGSAYKIQFFINDGMLYVRSFSSTWTAWTKLI